MDDIGAHLVDQGDIGLEPGFDLAVHGPQIVTNQGLDGFVIHENEGSVRSGPAC
jgi:hypothetical protein